jgi:hypothetical protein
MMGHLIEVSKFTLMDTLAPINDVASVTAAAADGAVMSRPWSN